MLRAVLLLSLCGVAWGQDPRAWAEAIVAQRLKAAKKAPEFPGAREWLNVSRPLTFAKDLKGKVVILDFWCYCCINCIHVLPDLEYLEKKYAGKAFAVVGVHSAKFTSEKDTQNIREAVRRYEIKHPVVNDGDFKVWRSFGASSWPTFAVVTPDGRLLGMLSGEGHREGLDALVEVLLEKFKDRLDATPLPIRLERGRRVPGQLAYPGKVLAHKDSLFIADSNHNRIVEVGLDGKFRRAWGDGERGLVDGKRPRFFRPQGMAVRDGLLYVADTENHLVRAIDLKTGTVTTVAGTGKQRAFRALPGDPSLSSPWDLEWIDNTLYIAMAGTHQLWKYDPATELAGVFAGNESEQRLDSKALLHSAFAQPSGFAWDGKWLYVADSESSSIVRVGLKGPVETLAGAQQGKPRNLFHFGDEDGKGWGKRFQHALGVEFHDGVLYVADTYNGKIKTVDRATGEVKTRWSGFAEPGGLSAKDGKLYVADTNNHAIKVIDLTTDKVSTLPLEGVPIPQARAREGGMGSQWPELPGTLWLGAGLKGSEFELVLDLPEGWKLTKGAPSAVRIDGKEQPLKGTTLKLNLEPGKHRVQLLYYVCQDAGTCRLRSVDYTVTVTKGVGKATLTDRFVP